jgi:GT2 family glycosyltransferase
VDNGSDDGTVEMLREQFPEITLVENQSNAGYTRPMNQALQKGRGRYLLQLNPDTLVLPNTLDYLVEFLDTHPEIGICTPKVLNQDGTLQTQCRRGESRPLAVIAYFTGLSRLFPHSKRFGQYLMSYMDENQTHPVAGVSGSCMLIRREVVDQIGYLDERFYAYQEDADYCFQAREAGWEIYYLPEVQIIHYGGRGGSRVEPYQAIFVWHQSYFRFYRKNLARDYLWFFNWLFYAAMFFKLLLSLLINFFRKDKFAGSRKP